MVDAMPVKSVKIPEKEDWGLENYASLVLRNLLIFLITQIHAHSEYIIK